MNKLFKWWRKRKHRKCVHRARQHLAFFGCDTSGMTDTTVGFSALATFNGTYVVLVDETDASVRTYRFDGTNWVRVGNSLTIPETNFPALPAVRKLASIGAPA